MCECKVQNRCLRGTRCCHGDSFSQTIMCSLKNSSLFSTSFYEGENFPVMWFRAYSVYLKCFCVTQILLFALLWRIPKKKKSRNRQIWLTISQKLCIRFGFLYVQGNLNSIGSGMQSVSFSSIAD